MIEEALRRDLGLDLLDRLWTANDLDEASALALAERSHPPHPRLTATGAP